MCHGIVWYHALCLHQNISKSSLVFCLDALTTGDDCLPAVQEVLYIPLAGWCCVCKHEQWRRYRRYRRTKRRRQQEHEVAAEADTNEDGVSQIAKKRKQSHGNDSQCMDVDADHVSPKQGRHHRVVDTRWPDGHDVSTAEYVESIPAEEGQLGPCPPRGRPRHRQSWIPVPKVQPRKSEPAPYLETSEDERQCRRRPRQSLIPVPAGKFQKRQPSGTTRPLKANDSDRDSFVDDFEMFDQETF
ncbi:hypothetical protein N7474_008564 [Penicillium riverlandense]|uniref:uncharacterized protein n=1 Tax=Penicillium riverlandense TaxID=1903569 RepID=UPI002547B2A3|nr:uncharacterized protein N7474_008564 [Penicillium riverlandense]KAJ5812263.1 hypothetical protein N7474_008564 [Penicillium riverlandense]